MLEILVDLCRKPGGGVGSGETATNKAGDIIVAKKQPCVWGGKEKQLFLITLLQDDALEATITDVIAVRPYAVYDKVDLGGGKFDNDLVNRSKYRVNLGMFDGSPGLDPTNVTQDPVAPNGKGFLELGDMTLDEGARC